MSALELSHSKQLEVGVSLQEVIKYNIIIVIYINIYKLYNIYSNKHNIIKHNYQVALLSRNSLCTIFLLNNNKSEFIAIQIYWKYAH